MRVRLTTVFRFRYPRRPGLAVLADLYEIPGRGVRRFTIYVWLYLDVGPAFGIFLFTYSLSFPPASFSLLALFQTLRRHKGRLLRQRLKFLYFPTAIELYISVDGVVADSVAVLFLLQKELDEKVASCTFLLSVRYSPSSFRNKQIMQV